MKNIAYILLCIASFGAIAQPVEVDASDNSKYGCSYANNDFYSYSNFDDVKYIQDSELVNSFFNNSDELFSFLKGKNPDYKFSKVALKHSSEYTLHNIYFDYKDTRMTMYRSVHHLPKGKEESKFLSFCYEGPIDSEIVRNFFPKVSLDKFKSDGDGVYYLIDDEGFHSIKLIRENNAYTKIFVYGGYD